MAVMPNGLTATADSKGMLFLSQVQIFESLRANPDFNRLTHVRQCFNALRCGGRLKVSRSTSFLPRPEVNGEDWFQLYGASQEFMRTLSESRVVLDLGHISWCLDHLSKGCVLESDLSPHFRILRDQLQNFVECDKVVRQETGHCGKCYGIEPSEFETVERAIESNMFALGDLLFYCYEGNTILTAEVTRRYINRYAGGIYTEREVSLHWPSINERMFGPGAVRETVSSAAFSRPNGFYVKRLPTFADGQRFATGKDYANVPGVEQAAVAGWPMSCEAFQLFGVTHKCWSDFWRPERFALPGFYVMENDICHCGGPDWDNEKHFFRTLNMNMLTIGNRIALHLGTLCRRTKPLTQDIGFGFLEAWKPVEGPPAQGGSVCSSCKNPLYLYNDFTICSFCGSIRNRS